MMGEACPSIGGRTMAEKDKKEKLTRICITVAKNGFEIEASYEPKEESFPEKGMGTFSLVRA